MPKVSVIIPVYGVEKYIERCARSLFEQTLDDIEYLFIDDCTPDRSIEILQQVLDEYPHRKLQVTIHCMEKNSGQAAVRKWGMQNATGEYITNCDSDDWLDKFYYEDMYNRIISTNADIVVADYYVDNGNNTIIQKGYLSTNNDFIPDFISMQNKCSLCNKLYRRSLFVNESFCYPKGNMGEDMCMILQIIPYCKKLEYIQKAYYHYVTIPTSICRNQDKNSSYNRFLQLKQNTDLVISKYKEIGLFPKYAKEFVYLKYHVKQQLAGLLSDKKYYELWRNTYSEVNLKIIFNKYVTIIDKIKFVVKYYSFTF